MDVLKKIIAGDRLRPTRLHTEAGIFVGWKMLPGLVPASFSWIWHRISGKYLLRPWWAYGAIKFVEENLRANDRVLEVGSGFSSLWLARRCRNVLSIEESAEWRERVSVEAVRYQVRNLTFVEGDSSEVFGKLIRENEYDVVIIDGPRDRMEIFQNLLSMEGVNHPKMIIYDDTDKIENKNALTVSVVGYETNVFLGFKPQTVHACETTVFKHV